MRKWKPELETPSNRMKTSWLQSKKTQTEVVRARLMIIWIGQDYPTGNSSKRKTKRQTEETIGRQDQRVDWRWMEYHTTKSGEPRGVEEAGCKVSSGAQRSVRLRDRWDERHVHYFCFCYSVRSVYSVQVNTFPPRCSEDPTLLFFPINEHRFNYILMDMACTGNESSLQSCPRTLEHNCSADGYAGVFCKSKSLCLLQRLQMICGRPTLMSLFFLLSLSVLLCFSGYLFSTGKVDWWHCTCGFNQS